MGLNIGLLGVILAIGDSVWSSAKRIVLEMSVFVAFKMTFEAIV